MSPNIFSWSVRQPIRVVMLTLAVMVLGAFALGSLNIDTNLLPRIIYPDIRVRILDSGVPAKIMEDEVTRQLEEHWQSPKAPLPSNPRPRRGGAPWICRSPTAPIGPQALPDASSRLDRAKSFLPESIDPPVIYKRR